MCSKKMFSEHMRTDRWGRFKTIRDCFGVGEEVESFIVDKGHENGAEIHTITSTGIIVISNKNTGKVITMLIAHPSQIIRYYDNEGKIAPVEIVEKARHNRQIMTARKKARAVA